MMDERVESDSMGEIRLPGHAYWGAQTQRAVENFGVSDKRIPVPMIHALGLIKRLAAETNLELGLLEPDLAGAIIEAAAEVAAGRWDDHFPIDVFQTGSGTSWNMNANEVIANRANELLGAPIGQRRPVHPNDHVNRGQSSNDVIPTAIHIADRIRAGELVSALEALAEALAGKTREFGEIIKLGRTHLQDAVPMTLGQEFSGYAEQAGKGAERVRSVFGRLEELALGGTALGTGINTHSEFAARTIRRISGHTGLPFRPAANPFEAIASRDAQAELMGALSTVAGSLAKIANDLRLLAGGPRAGLGEIILPSLQPGSSIMPGKVNPVIPEMVIQAAAHVQGQHLAVSIGAQSGPLEMNIMMPLIAYETLDALALLANVCAVFRERCIAGIEADPERCRHWVDWSLALVTPLATRIGYDQAAAIAHQAYREGRTVREVIIERNVLSAEEADRVLDPRAMIHPQQKG